MYPNMQSVWALNTELCFFYTPKHRRMAVLFAFEKLNETYEDTLLLIEKLKNTSKGDYTSRILWASDCPVGEFNHSQNSYSKNLELFKFRISEKFQDETLLENLLYNNAKNLYKI